MAIMTKQTQITWGSYEDVWEPESFVDQRMAKLHEMETAGKTDGYYNAVSPVIYIRHWLDQNAAEEYSGFITTLASTFQRVIVDIQISDIPT